MTSSELLMPAMPPRPLLLIGELYPFIPPFPPFRSFPEQCKRLFLFLAAFVKSETFVTNNGLPSVLLVFYFFRSSLFN